MITNLKSHLLTGKKLLTLLLFVFMMGEMVGQNLVPNGSFEIDSLCPNALDHNIYLAIPWINPTYGSPDYWNGCAGSAISSAGVPQNWLGYQNARTGVAYAGIYCYDATTGSTEIKEYLQVRLDSTLVFQKQYCISFYVNLAKPYYVLYNEVAITQIGMYISDDTISLTNQNTLPHTPQIQSPSGVYLNDTINWVEISGTYTAHGGEKYITIGNFNLHTDTIGVVNCNNWSGAYYFIDDVSIIDCTPLEVDETNPTPEITLYPNPCEKELGIKNYELGIKEIRIYNVLGELVKSEQLTANSKEIDVSNLPSGLYFAEIQTKKGVVRRKFVKE